MESVKVKINNKTINVPSGITLDDLSKEYASDFKHDILLAEVNNELRELHYKVEYDCTIRFLDITDKNGFRAYQRSAIFLMICACKEILGKKVRVVVEHSINKNCYCEIINDGINDNPAGINGIKEVTDELLNEIENRMKQIAEEDFPIEKYSLSIEKAERLCEEFGLNDKTELLKFRRTSNVNYYKLSWFYDYFYGQLVSHTSLLKFFKLVKKYDGFILQLPDVTSDKPISDITHFDKISGIFRESSQWARILNIDTVGALNKKICNGELGNIIRTAEALHEKKVAEIADKISLDKKRIVLIAGPSSSGKTTFSHRLSIQLKVNGIQNKIISIDDYFNDQENTPSAENPTEFDFESIEAVDYKLLQSHLVKLLNGETVEIPSFNFGAGKREYKGHFLTVKKDEVLIVEGIHGLNEKISNQIDAKDKFKVFISALTQLNVDDHNRIPTTDTRLLRRIIRDFQYRKVDAVATIRMWAQVTQGEARNIFPYQEQADAIFNSALSYELCVLKQYVEPVLFAIGKDVSEYTEARRLIKFLDSFLGVSSGDVPKNSIIREFIGGSCF